MKNIKIDFILHWLYAVIFGILMLTGLALMSPKFGWIMNYELALADYLHRTLAPAYVFLAIGSMGLEAYRLSGPKQKGMPWLVITKTTMGIFTLVTTLLITLSGLFIWFCQKYSPATLAFALVMHELFTFISVIFLLWHIYDKAHGLPFKKGAGRNV